MQSVKCELIGTNVKVMDSENESAKRIEGTIIDETKHMLTIESKDGSRKRLIKSQHTFKIGDALIEGKELDGRPDERIKRWIRRK